MAKEPENLVLEHLRNIRAEMKEMQSEINIEFHDIRGILGEHSRRFDFLEERVEMLREGTLTTIGQKQIADLTQRVERLEQAK